MVIEAGATRSVISLVLSAISSFCLGRDEGEPRDRDTVLLDARQFVRDVVVPMRESNRVAQLFLMLHLLRAPVCGELNM
jgi:hypothetical protein